MSTHSCIAQWGDASSEIFTVSFSADETSCYSINSEGKVCIDIFSGITAPRVGPLRFLTGDRKRHTKSGCRLFCWLWQFFRFLFCVSGICGVVFDCFWLSVAVQLIA